MSQSGSKIIVPLSIQEQVEEAKKQQEAIQRKIQLEEEQKAQVVEQLSSPTPCNRLDCADKYRESDRWRLILLMYSHGGIIDPPVQFEMTNQVCKDCRDKIKVSDITSGNEGNLAGVFKVCTARIGEPIWGARRQLDISRCQLAFKLVGKYQKPPDPAPNDEPLVEVTPSA